MSNEVAVYGEQALTAQEIRAQVNLIQEVMKAVMKEGVHFGKVPGTDKPTLLKPGAEKIMATFRLAADPEVEDLSTHDSIRYRVKCRLISPSGREVGAGVGECSTDEEKYKWKAAVNHDEYEAIPEDRRRLKWKKGYGGKSDFQIEQIRTEPADLANTVLKMAKKRALVDASLTATAASDIFTQDIEDLPPELRAAASEEAPPEPLKEPQEKQTAEEKAPPTTENEQKTIALVEDVKVKTGKGNKGAWTNYQVKAGGETYGTFSDTLGAAAQSLIGVKADIKWWQDGKYKTITAIEPATEEAPPY